jgi:hypothetical protein
MLGVHCLSYSSYTFWHCLLKELFMARITRTGETKYFFNYQQMADTTGNLKNVVTAQNASHEML